MAHVRETRIKRVIFEDDHPRWAGLTIETRGVAIRQFAQFARIFAEVSSLNEATGQMAQVEAMEEAARRIDEVKELFASLIVRWDMQFRDEDGNVEDIPPTADGLGTLDDDEFIALVQDWMQAVGGVPAPLDDSSSELSDAPSSIETFPDLSEIPTTSLPAS